MKTQFKILILLVLISSQSFGQEKYFYCKNKLYSIPSWSWSEPNESCDNFRLDFYTDSLNFNEIPLNDRIIIDRTKEYIIQRGGKEFYNNLTLKYVLITKRPKKCDNRKYTLRYLFPIDSIFSYKFSITLDKYGNLLSDHLFPNISSNKDILYIIDHCQATEIAMGDSTFLKAFWNSGISSYIRDEKSGNNLNIEPLSQIEFSYDKERNIWTWDLYTESSFKSGYTHDAKFKDNLIGSCQSGEWIGKKIIINAHNSEIIKVEDYKEFKSVLYDE
ncbi:MAG: hypothetical protein HXX16_20145 [Bacteroidales bacterium]|nr:hypothetical protein [Bacteroidales bacterium]